MDRHQSPLQHNCAVRNGTVLSGLLFWAQREGGGGVTVSDLLVSGYHGLHSPKRQISHLSELYLNLTFMTFGRQGEDFPFFLSPSFSKFITTTRRAVPGCLLGYSGSVAPWNMRGPLNLNTYLQKVPQTWLRWTMWCSDWTVRVDISITQHSEKSFGKIILYNDCTAMFSPGKL
jgi:hypothetical protein